nr:ribonuclease H-like domain-containing protein [Tanacetum cinerariifolium]
MESFDKGAIEYNEIERPMAYVRVVKEVMDFELPIYVNVKVVEGGTKPLETGVVVNVLLFVDRGHEIVLDTRIGHFQILGGHVSKFTVEESISQMHNNIMAAGSKDRPPMLAPGRYPQWRLRFLRYVDTRPNVPEHTTVETLTNMSPENKAHFLAEKEAIHLILTGIGDDIYSTVDACQTAQEMWEAIERLQQGQRSISSTTSAGMVEVCDDC